MGIDTGDYIIHEPSGEKWIVACVQGEYLSWMGWPEGMAKLEDCKLLEKATPEYRMNLLHEQADSMTNDHRSIFARHRLAAMSEAPMSPELKWTTDKPTVPGWYWTRHAQEKPHIVMLYRRHTGALAMLVMGYPNGLEVQAEQFRGSQWAGPLELPKESR